MNRTMTMDIQRPSNAHAKKIRRIIYACIAVVSVDKATIWTDEVKRGPMLRDVHGLGTLVPEDIRWIPAQTDSRVDSSYRIDRL